MDNVSLEHLRSIQGNNPYERKRKVIESDFQPSESLKKYIESLKAPEEAITVNYATAREVFWNYYKAEVQKTKPDVVMTSFLKEVLPKLIQWLIDSPEAETPWGMIDLKPMSLRKGLFFYGPKGTGKTAILKALQKTALTLKLKKHFLFNEAPTIFDEVQFNKDFNLTPYYTKNRAFDDVGFSEPFVKSYGNEIRPMEVIFRNRYNKFVNFGEITIVSSNLDNNGLKVHFDERVLDRFNEMFNIILFEGDSFRKI